MPDGRYKIGLLVANITDLFSNQITCGAMAAAEELDADLFIFPGKYYGLEYLYERLDSKYEYQYNALFDIAGKSGLDYLIVAIGTIAYACDMDKKLAIMDSLGDVPKLSLAAKLPGYDYLTFDNKTGIVQAVEHLAGQGKKHIAMLAGDLNNPDCLERRNAYKSTMKRLGLEIGEGYICECDISEKCSEQVDEFIDRVKDIDAVVCVNDMVAKELYTALKKRGIRVGTDIAVTGFDDQIFAAEMEPPLASVKADAVEMGRRSVERAVNFLNGVRDEDSHLPTSFVPRHSSSAVGELYNSLETVFSGTLEEVLANFRVFIKNQKSDDLTALVENGLFERFDRLIGMIYSAVVDNEPVEDQIFEIFAAASELLSADCFSMDNAEKIYRLVYGGYGWFAKLCDPKNLAVLRRLQEYIYERMAVAQISCYRALQTDYIERTHVNNRFIRDTLMFKNSSDCSYSLILRRLSDIGGSTAFLYLLKEPVTHPQGAVFKADCEWQFKAYSYGNEVHSIAACDQRISVGEIFRNDKLPDRRFTVIAADLYSTDQQYGIALIEPNTTDFFEDLELVCYQLSSSIRTVGLLQSQDQILADLHSRNLALDEMSKIDELTRIFNRRGFYLAADQLINNEKYAGQEMVVCFADMDNLKLVNDSYGHIEGDFSLRYLADCMCRIFGVDAVIGRVGGDEFAAIAPITSCGGIDEIRARKDKLIASFESRGDQALQAQYVDGSDNLRL